MISIILFFVAFAAFSLASRGLIMAVTENILLEKFSQPYSFLALKVGRYYKITAWGFLTLALFGWTIQSFVTVFNAL